MMHMDDLREASVELGGEDLFCGCAAVGVSQAVLIAPRPVHPTHGDAIDRVCRTGGGSDHLFFELKDGSDYASKIKLVAPVNDLNVVVGASVKQVAPDRFLHPVHVLRRYLDAIGTVTDAQFGIGRVVTVDSRKQVEGSYPGIPAPVPEPDETFVQPPQGAGPEFFYQ